MFEYLDSYALSDFLLFSRETYYRLFELYNRDVWPLHVFTEALAVALLWLLARRPAHAGRPAAAVLTAVWVWVGWAFHLERYATINIAAPYFAALFGLVALLLFCIGVLGNRLRMTHNGIPDERAGPGKRGGLGKQAGIGLVLFAAFINPLVGLAAGRHWTELSIFGLGPDPTAIATIGVLLASKGRLRWLPAVPVIIWCVISILTAVAMGSIEFIGPVVAIATLAFVVTRTFRTQIYASSAPRPR